MLTGQKIAKLRIQADLTQEQLAEKLYVSRELVSKWETDKRYPNYETVLKLSKIFSVDSEEIINKNDILLSELSDCIPNNYNNNTNSMIVDLNIFLSTLNERDRSVFIRRYYFMDEIPTISEEYNIKESYVRTILMRTRKKLIKFFKSLCL